MTLSDLFTDGDTRTFEEQRAEVISILERATDLSGREQYLRQSVLRCQLSSTEGEFDRAYETLVGEISNAPMCA